MQDTAARRKGVGKTERRDTWWLQPLLTVVALGAFVAYATWVAFTGDNYWVEPYLSPFYSPLLGGNLGEPVLKLRWWPFTPAILVLWVPLGFRLTCYYGRRTYYRAFFWDPPACAVGEPRKGYHGESRFPFILQNLHRYFFYLSLVVVAFLWYDAVRGFVFDGRFGVGVGSLLLLAEALLLSMYSLSCHCLRHVAGGCVDCLSRRPARYRLWRWVSALNANHGLWFWISLSGAVVADLYIRLVATGAVIDLRIV
ncbi:MAG: putative integral rane protein [Dehalococcoidia bacterium]|nr:putative integral rane protein [Dehalococcoidia bacterium]